MQPTSLKMMTTLLLAMGTELAVAFGPGNPLYVSRVTCTDGASRNATTSVAAARSLPQIADALPLARSRDDGGEIAYYLSNHCLKFTGHDQAGVKTNFSQLYIYDDKAKKLNVVVWTGGDACDGPPAVNNPVPLDACTNGELYEMHTEIPFTDNVLFEFFESTAECTNAKNSDPIIISSESLGCTAGEKGATDARNVTMYCDPVNHVLKMYTCDDAKCESECHPYWADMTLETCYNTSAIAPQDDPDSDVIDDFVVRVKKNTC